jgi:hypothetical protein
MNAAHASCGGSAAGRRSESEKSLFAFLGVLLVIFLLASAAWLGRFASYPNPFLIERQPLYYAVAYECILDNGRSDCIECPRIADSVMKGT